MSLVGMKKVCVGFVSRKDVVTHTITETRNVINSVLCNMLIMISLCNKVNTGCFNLLIGYIYKQCIGLIDAFMHMLYRICIGKRVSHDD